MTTYGYYCVSTLQQAIEGENLEVPPHGIVGQSFGAAAHAIAMRNGVMAERAVLISSPSSLRHVVSGFAKIVDLPSKSHEKMYPLMETLQRCPESEQSFETIGQNLETPYLLIHDATDQYSPQQDDEMVPLSINGAQIVRTKGLGHMRILQDDGVVARVPQFVCEPAKQLFMAA